MATVRGSGSITVESGARKVERKTFTRQGGMCPRCEGRGAVSDIDLTQLFDGSKSLAEGAIIVPGWTTDNFFAVKPYLEAGFLDPDKPVHKYTKAELHDFLHHEPTRVKVNGVNVTYEGLVPKVERSFLSKDREALQPHIRAFVERAATFTTCPQCGGTRLNDIARSSKVKGTNIADACTMEIRELTEWARSLDQPSVAPFIAALCQTLDAFVEVGLGYLSLERPTGTLSGGEAQRVRTRAEGPIDLRYPGPWCVPRKQQRLVGGSAHRFGLASWSCAMSEGN
jgi:excinuclease UvrABC ATPase subunit